MAWLSVHDWFEILPTVTQPVSQHNNNRTTEMKDKLYSPEMLLCLARQIIHIEITPAATTEGIRDTWPPIRFVLWRSTLIYIIIINHPLLAIFMRWSRAARIESPGSRINIYMHLCLWMVMMSSTQFIRKWEKKNDRRKRRKKNRMRPSSLFSNFFSPLLPPMIFHPSKRVCVCVFFSVVAPASTHHRR